MSKQKKTTAGIVGNTTTEQLEAAAIRTAAILKELLEAAPNTPAEADERNKGIVKCLDGLADFREAIRAKEHNADDVSASETANTATVRIAGKSRENLNAITRIFAAWSGKPTTASQLLKDYLTDDPAINSLRTKKASAFDTTFAGMIVSKYGENSELRSAFEAEGFSVIY